MPRPLIDRMVQVLARYRRPADAGCPCGSPDAVPLAGASHGPARCADHLDVPRDALWVGRDGDLVEPPWHERRDACAYRRFVDGVIIDCECGTHLTDGAR